MLNGLVSLNDEELEALSLEVRKEVFEVCRSASSGHIGGSSGAVELMLTLYFGGILRFNPHDSADNRRDRVLVRGHLGPLRYTIFSLIGFLDKSELKSYRSFGSRLHGHEDHIETPGVDITPSGSLGMLLSYGVGSALAARNIGSEYLTYVFLGDGEEQEGNVSEAARHAAGIKLDNLIAIIDQNTKQLSDPILDVDTSDVAKIWEGYGWTVMTLASGHDIREVRRAYHEARLRLKEFGRPVVILARTCKGHGLAGADAHFSGYHTISTCGSTIVDDAIKKFECSIVSAMPHIESAKRKICSSGRTPAVDASRFDPIEVDIKPGPTTSSNPDESQVDYFRQLAKRLGEAGVAKERMYFLTADVTRQDHVKLLGLRSFCTYLNVGIREQHMVAMAHAISVTDPASRILINSLDAFTYRGIDQINAAVQGASSMVVIGDVAGLTNAKNGKTHQSAGQPGAILTMPGICFLEPWDTVDTFNCLNWAIGKSRGVVFIRIHSSLVRVQGPVATNRSIRWYIAYEPNARAEMTIVASGLTVGTSIEAANHLEQEGLPIRVISVVDHKSLNAEFAAKVTVGKPLLTVYNGAAEVLQANVSKVLLQEGIGIPSVVRGLGFKTGTTGSTDDLLRHYGLDGAGVINAVKSMV